MKSYKQLLRFELFGIVFILGKIVPDSLMVNSIKLHKLPDHA